MQGGVGEGHDIFCVSFAMHASLTNLEILVTRVNQARTHPSILSAGDSSYVFSKSEGLPRRARLSLRAVIFTSTEIEWLREIYSC